MELKTRVVHHSRAYDETRVRSLRVYAVACVLLAVLAVSTGCSPQPSNNSDVKVTDVKHTIVKRQSIGNCWLYAEATWLESLLKSHTNTDINVSESYWTWWHWYGQLTGRSFSEKKIDTSGSWDTAGKIIREHGWVLAGEFIDEENSLEMSVRQQAAMDKINQQLKPGGRLYNVRKRTPEVVRAELDKAFGTNMAQAETLMRSAATTMVDKDAGGEISLLDMIVGPENRRWREIDFPADEAGRKITLARVFKALNDYKPVLMSVNIDFNAQDTDDNGSFKKSVLDEAGEPGDQGGHMVVLKDYTVTNAPGYGTLGAGDLPAEQKAAAVEGELATLIAKNSWGRNRSDRGMVDGFTTFYLDYLYGPIRWLRDEENKSSPTDPVVPLESFVMPPNY